MIIQRLGASDLTLMRQLNLMFATAFDDAERYAAATPSDDYIVQLLGQDHVFALVAQDSENVVGGLVAYELPKLEQARSEIYIYDLAVAETHRRRGIATGLINKLRDLAAGRGCWAWLLGVAAGRSMFRQTMATIRRSPSIRNWVYARMSCIST